MEKIKIRRYRKNDKEKVRKLIINVWGRRWLPGVMHAFEDYDGFVAEADGKIIGGMTLDWGSYAIVLDELIVNSEKRGQGIGKSLLEFSIDYARKNNLKFIKTFVEANNKNALALYRKYGFRKYGELRNSFELGDHYFYMCKLL